MLLPTSRLYLRWSEHVNFEDCRKIVTDFADDNFTNAVDIEIWYESGHTCLTVNFAHLIYKIECDTLAYRGKIYNISGEIPLQPIKLPADTKYFSPYVNVLYRDTTYRGIIGSLMYVTGSCLFWAVSKQDPIFSTLASPHMFDEWKVYYNISEFTNLEACGRYILVITEEPSIEMYETIEHIVTNGSKVLVMTPWVPRLPTPLNDRKWCFANVTHQGDRITCDHFTPERVSRAKSARK